jgi:hypothetical protein
MVIKCRVWGVFEALQAIFCHPMKAIGFSRNLLVSSYRF